MSHPVDSIFAFEDEYFFLSNFYPWPVLFEGEIYPTAEHAYQAAKFTDPMDRKLIKGCSTPGRAKKAAHIMKSRSDPTFPGRKLTVMESSVLRVKFQKNNRMGQQLIWTRGYDLVEGNHHHDRFWGVHQGVGENNLGKILMKIRDDL